MTYAHDHARLFAIDRTGPTGRPGVTRRPGAVGLLATLLGTTALSLAAQARADAVPSADAAGSVSEVIVTAQKRVSTVQATAASITATTGDDLKARGITSVADLAQSTPGVSLKSEGPSQTEIEMRGMTSSGGDTATVGFYIDDVPLTGPAGAQNGHVVIDPSLYDLSRVEILRGPQGTLYGGSSMGGTVKLVTNPPNPESYQASGESTLSGTEGGGFNHINNFMVNLPLVKDQLAFRLVGTENYTSGWIDRIVGYPFPVTNYNSATNYATRGDVQDAPVQAQYPHSNAYQLYSVRASLLWEPTPNLTITPAFFFETSKQNGPSAYDSVPGITNAHYQPFDIAEPLTDRITIISLTANYSFEAFDVTSSTSQWWRKSTQVQDASEEFNNPTTAATYASNNGLPAPGYYGPNGTGVEYGFENDPSQQFSEELRFTSKGDGKLKWVGGLFFSNFDSLWTFAGTTPNYSAYMDLGTFAPATTPNWFDAYEPTSMIQYALFGDATYDLTSKLKAEVGLRWNYYDYKFSSCISGWGSGMGAAEPSCSGLIKLYEQSLNPKFNLSYTFNRDMLVYGTVSNGSRPGGGDSVYPTTGGIWGPAFAPYNYTSGKWPSTYAPDYVWSFEVGEKARFFDRRLTLNTSAFYEDWEHIQLEAYPNVWALNINGNRATIYGGEIDADAVLPAGFDLQVTYGYLQENLDPGPHWQIQPRNVLPEVTPVTGDLILRYSKSLGQSLTVKAQVEASYTGHHYSLAFPNGYETNGEYIELPSYVLVNLRATLISSHGWSVAAFVDNVTNEHAQLESLFQESEATSTFNRIVTNQPLTAGVDLNIKFN
jgi:outer membrane receptor protein involved in Fe transport